VALHQKPIERPKSEDWQSPRPLYSAQLVQRTLRWPYRRPRQAIATVVTPQPSNAVIHGNPQQIDVISKHSASATVAAQSKIKALGEGSPMHTIPMYKRAVWLTADAIVLTIASPFFAAWWLTRAIKRKIQPK
jgi:hypothetical protein